MRTTLDLSESLINAAMKITKCKTKTELFTVALTNIIRKKQIEKLINFHGKLDLNIDIKNIRKR